MSLAATDSFVEPQVQRWVEALLPWVMNDLRYPVEVENRKGCWRIEILGALRVDLNHDQCGFRIAARQQGGFAYNNRADLRLRTMLASTDWLVSWVWRRAHRCGIEIASLPCLIPMIARELRGLISDQSIYAARSAIRAALPLDADILALAIRANPLPVLTLRHYTATAKFRADMLVREQRSPALLPVFESHERFTEFGYGVGCGKLKEYLRGGGLSNGGWRLLLRHGRRLWQPLRRSHEFQRHPDRILRDWANIVAALPRRDVLPPSRIALAWVQTYSMRSAKRDGDTSHQARLVMAAWRRWDAIETGIERRRWTREELLPVMAWAQTLSHSPPQAPDNAGFAWYLRQQHAANIELIANQIDQQYPGEFDFHFDFGELRFTMLGSRASLYRAGMRFHNCLAHVADNYDGCISPGSYYIVSHRANGKALALLRADANACGEPRNVLELRGPCNLAVSSQVTQIVWQFARFNHTQSPSAGRAIRVEPPTDYGFDASTDNQQPSEPMPPEVAAARERIKRHLAPPPPLH